MEIPYLWYVCHGHKHSRQLEIGSAYGCHSTLYKALDVCTAASVLFTTSAIFSPADAITAFITLLVGAGHVNVSGSVRVLLCLLISN